MGSSWQEVSRERGVVPHSRWGLAEAELRGVMEPQRVALPEGSPATELLDVGPLKVGLPKSAEPSRAAMLSKVADALSAARAQWPEPNVAAAPPAPSSTAAYSFGLPQATLYHPHDFAPPRGKQEIKDMLGKAMKNLQQMEALDGLISYSLAAGSQFTSMPHFQVAERRRAQIQREQLMLLSQLQDTQQPQAQPPLIHSPWRAAAAAPPPSQWAAPPGDHGGWDTRVHQWQDSTAQDAWSSSKAEATSLQRPAPTLSSSLQLLADVDPECLFIVRRINKLGFKATKKLKDHFSQYGKVARVLVAHSTVKAQFEPDGSAVRQRPSSLGFLQMASKAAVQRVLGLGEEQKVEDVFIRVQKFVRKQTDDGEGDGLQQADGGEPADAN